MNKRYDDPSRISSPANLRWIGSITDFHSLEGYEAINCRFVQHERDIANGEYNSIINNQKQELVM